MATSMAVCSTGGKLTKKRAPPDLLAPTATFAPILWVISFTIDRPRPLPPAELQSAAPESREDALPELFRNARALIIDDQTARSLSTRM